MTTIPHDDERFWHGHIALEKTADWTRAWRLPLDQIALFASTNLPDCAATPAGVRLAFHTDSSFVEGEIVPVEGNMKLDLCCDGILQATADLDNVEKFQFAELPRGGKLIELWLPQCGDFRLRALRLEDGASLRPCEDARPKWTTYGSSITHCCASESPTLTWPAIVARERDLNLTCLGFGGECHLDTMIALTIRDRPVDFISLCLGINMHGGSVGPRAFRTGIIGFVQIIREKHPTTPILLISPIYSPPRETKPNAVGWTLPRMREAVRAAAQTLRECGDENIQYLDGLELFGPEYSHLLPDDLHPNSEGYQQMGRNFLDKAAALLFD